MRRIVLLISMVYLLSDIVGQTSLIVQIEASLSPSNLIQTHLIVPQQSGSLMSMQGTIEFDPDICSFQTSEAGNPIGLTATTTGQVASGQIGFSWLVDDGNAIAFSAGDTLASFTFSPLATASVAVPFSLTSNGLAIEFVGEGLTILEVAAASTSFSWDTNEGFNSSASLVLAGTQFENGERRIDLQSTETLQFLSCQGTISWEVPGTVTSLESNLLENLDFQDAIINDTSMGWSWFSPNVTPIPVDTSEPILSIWIQFDLPFDSMLVSLNSSLIEIEFIDENFMPIEISPIEQTIVFVADSSGVFCNDCIPGCTYSLACNFNPLADSDDGSCAFPELGYDCNGNCVFDIDQDGICDFEETNGCTYSNASNYNPLASQDNGSCFFQLAPSCPTDVDNDGVTGVSDVLTLLSNFGLICEN